MIRWGKKEKSQVEEIADNWQNAFYKNGFVNEKIFKNPNRDIAEHFIKAMSQTSSGAFDYILMGWKEVYPDALTIKNIELEKYLAKMNSNKKGATTVASVSPDVKNYKIYKALLIVNPNRVSDDRKYYGVLNVRKAIAEGILDEYDNVNHDAINFINDFRFDDVDYTSKKDVDTEYTLFIQPKEYLIPILKYGLYYNLDGTKRYPQYTEEHYHARNNSDELTFLYKYNVPGSKSNTFEGYFGLGVVDGKHIHYIKHSGRTYNMFTIFKPYIAKKLYTDLMTSSNRELKQIVKNTYADYEKYMNARKVHNNILPTLLDGVEKTERNSKPINTIPISNEDVRKLVISYHTDEMKFNLYGSIESALLKANAIGGSKSAKNDKQTGAILRGEQIVVSVKANALLTVANQNSNPLDVFLLASYRRALSGKCVADFVKTEERFIESETYHLKDPISSRSETSVGIVSNLILHMSDEHLTD